MKLELHDPHAPACERVWRSLEAPSYFLSWGWVANWLACLPRHHTPRLAVFVAQGVAVAACFLASRVAMHGRVFPSRTLHLNATGIARYDDLVVEHNGLVGQDLPLAELVRSLPGGWDELFLPGMSAEALGSLATTAHVQLEIRGNLPSYYVDLDKVRTADYLALLSGQTRAQVRRAHREAGEITIEIARDPREAIDIYDELVALHTESWRQKGKPGAFADAWFDRFHRRLIGARFPHGEIQLIRARHASGTMGCLYNFVCRGRVLQYQSGFAPYASQHMKPGFIVHAAAIEHAAANGHAIYDFLAGDVRYKKSLSTDSTQMIWACVQRPRLRFAIEGRARRWLTA